MQRHAATRIPRSSAAERAHRAGLVTDTIDLCSPPATTARRRLTNAAARNSVTLAITAMSVWIYDLARIARGA